MSLRRVLVCSVLFSVGVGATAAQAQSWPSVSTELERAGGGDSDAALIIGVSEYAFLPKVPGAADNAADWFQYLVKVRGVPAERVVFLRDTDASRERMERELDSLARAARPGGTAWFIFIGHGAPAPSGDDGLLLGMDTQPNADSLGGRGVAQNRALQILQAGKQAQTVAVFDACFSGKTGDGARPLVEGLQATPPLRKAASLGKVTVLSSSETFAGPLPDQRRPAFSYVLLGALRGWADRDGDRSVSVEEATTYARDALRATLKTTDRLPSARGQTTGVVLARGVTEPGPEIEAIVLQRCPAGKRWKERRCEAVPCPPGTEFDGSTCAATAVAVTCPGRATWNGTQCVAAQVTCPPHATWDGTQCVGSAATPPTTGSVLGSTPEPARAVAVAEPRRVVLTDTQIHFNFTVQPKFQTGKHRLTAEGEVAVDELAGMLRDHPGFKATIEVHTDSQGDDAANRRLSQGRAEEVVAYLVRKGIAANRLQAKGYGEEMPIASNQTAEGRARNRRVEVRVEE